MGSPNFSRMHALLPILRALPEYCFACGFRTRFHRRGQRNRLGTNPNRTHDQPKPYLETIETVLDLYSDKDMLRFLLRGAITREIR